MTRTLLSAAAFLVAGALTCTAASGAVITFGPGPLGSPVASTNEGIFTYDTLAGALFRDSEGNGDAFNMEGLDGVGGTLRIVRNDVAGGLFSFDGADIGWQFNRADDITFEGLFQGVTVATDIFTTNALSTYTTVVAINLAGLAIDELRVTLPAPPGTASILDNVVLTPADTVPVPAPATLALLGGALVALRLSRRRA